MYKRKKYQESGIGWYSRTLLTLHHNPDPFTHPCTFSRINNKLTKGIVFFTKSLMPAGRLRWQVSVPSKCTLHYSPERLLPDPALILIKHNSNHPCSCSGFILRSPACRQAGSAKENLFSVAQSVARLVERRGTYGCRL